MPYLILTTDEPDSLELRNELRPIHLDYLIAHQDKLLAGGALLSDDGSGGHGGCIIVDTEAGDTVLGAKQGRKDLGRPATLMAAKIGLKAGSKVT